MADPIKNLVPFTPGFDVRRMAGGSWPGWRLALRRVVGDGEVLFQKLHDLAMGIPQVPTDDEGKPIRENVYDLKGAVIGTRDVLIQIPPVVQKAAAAELLDRAFGKPVQVVVDLTPDGVGEGEYVPAKDLTEDERAIIRQIAKRRMLVTKVVEGEVVLDKPGSTG